MFDDKTTRDDRLSRKEEEGVLFYIIGLSLFFLIGALIGLSL